MPHRLYSRRFLAWWVGQVERHHIAALVLFTIVTMGIIAYSAVNFKVDANLTNMVSEKLPFRNLEKVLYREFPQLTDVIVVVVNADSVGEAMDARKLIADSMRKETRLFQSVQEPGGAELFERNGLLFLDPPELEGLSDNLAKGEPLMGLLFKDYSLRGFFSLMGTILDNYDNEAAGEMDIMFDQMGAALTNASRGRSYHLPWETMMYGEKEAAEQRNQFIIIKPYLDKDGMIMGNPPTTVVRQIISKLNLGDSVKIRLTGDVILSYDNVTTVQESVGFATFASLVLVGLVIIIGLGSGRLVLASLLTLLAGLVWTTGFALFAIGSLNLISITFAVLFVGLGIDYGIQFCLRYRELVEAGHDNRESLITTASGVGTGLFLSCVTTSVGFFAFLPTAYSGVAQLGLISGVGMYIALFCSLTLLPALLTLFRFRKGMSISFMQKMPITDFPYKHYKAVSVISLVLGLCCAATLPMVYFDYNPLNLYDQKSETIITLKELFKNKQAPPWTISVLTRDKQAAEDIRTKLGQLKEVKWAVTVSDFVPDKMQEKLDIISNIALFMPDPQLIKVNKLTYEEKAAALNELEGKLAKFLEKNPGAPAPKVEKLLAAVREFKKHAQAPGNGEKAFAVLDDNLLYGLPSLLKRLDKMLHPVPFTEADLPADLVRDYVSPNGYYRVQVFPREDILQIDALGRFVNAVKTVTPNGVDAPVSIYETGKAIASSFRFATLMSLAAVVLILCLTLRRLFATALVLLPLALAIFLTAATSVIFDLPLNYANVIVLPLLLGVGVHSGIMFMLRYMIEPPSDGNMLTTSTARAVFYSNVTMIISTATLAFSAHRGIASMGILLSVCFGFILVAVLVVFPALLKLFVNLRAKERPAAH